MYKEHWIHSLLYFKFVELTLIYDYIVDEFHILMITLKSITTKLVNKNHCQSLLIVA